MATNNVVTISFATMDQKLSEALALSEELLKNIELSETPLTSSFLKAARIARLVGDQKFAEIFRYEVAGYPSEPDGIPSEIFELCRLAGRVSITKEGNKQIEKAKMFSVGTIEETLAAERLQLSQSGDRDVSVTYSNPNQIQMAPAGNWVERNQLRSAITTSAEMLSGRRAFLYQWALDTYYDLKFSQEAYDVFAQTQRALVELASKYLPSEMQKISSAIDDLSSNNPEKWANAAHSCRRLLQEAADLLYPARDDVEKVVNGQRKVIKLGAENYINRLVAFAEDRMQSTTARQIVGSNLAFIGDRLDAIFAAVQKGSHSEIGKEEGERIFIHTALLATDLLRMRLRMDQ